MTRGTREAVSVPDYWAPFEGIPLCHTPRTPEEEAELAKKGACACTD